jgi:hypothetical protein
MADNKCGDCAFLITEDGEPYYCAIRDLYTLREASDKACGEFVSNLTKQDVEAVQDLMAFKERYKDGKQIRSKKRND